MRLTLSPVSHDPRPTPSGTLGRPCAGWLPQRKPMIQNSEPWTPAENVPWVSVRTPQRTRRPPLPVRVSEPASKPASCATFDVVMLNGRRGSGPADFAGAEQARARPEQRSLVRLLQRPGRHGQGLVLRQTQRRAILRATCPGVFRMPRGRVPQSATHLALDATDPGLVLGGIDLRGGAPRQAMAQVAPATAGCGAA